jgi:hypothetical protein
VLVAQERLARVPQVRTAALPGVSHLESPTQTLAEEGVLAQSAVPQTLAILEAMRIIARVAALPGWGSKPMTLLVLAFLVAEPAIRILSLISRLPIKVIQGIAAVWIWVWLPAGPVAGAARRIRLLLARAVMGASQAAALVAALVQWTQAQQEQAAQEVLA